MKNKHEGFVALFSIIMMSVVLFASTLSLAQLGLASRSYMLELENKRMSERFADACVQTARINVYNNPLLESNTEKNIPIGNGTCTVIDMHQTVDGNETEVAISSTYKNAVTNFMIRIESESGDIVSWKEVKNHEI